MTRLDLSFRAVTVRNPPWVRDEIVLACDLVRQNGWRDVSQADPRVHELSELLRRLPLHPAEVRAETFRNPNAVSRKVADIATCHPDYIGRRTRGNRLDRVVLDEFLADTPRMTELAAQLRRVAALPGASVPPPDLDSLDAGADEGGLLERRHFARERDQKLRQRKIDAVRRAGRPLACEACGFDFAAAYGEHGAGYIECHHRTPLHVSGPVHTTPDDLALLCSNCHRMIHHRRPWLAVEHLRDLVRQHVTDGTRT